MDRRIHRPTANRKRSTLELPPTDLIGLTLEAPFLHRRATQEFLDAPGPFNNWTLVHEPEGLPEVHDSLRDIERVHQAYSRRVEADWQQTPSRTSSADSEHDISEGLKHLDLEDHYVRSKFPTHFDHGLPPGTASFGPPTDPPRSGGSRPGPSRQSTGRSRGYSSSKGAGKGSVAGGGVLHSRIIKPTGTTSTKATRKTVATSNTQSFPFGCPMAKGNCARYISVLAPCTDLRGIKATSKALMEHLKKHHSRDNRCMTCLKWFKNQAELVEHRQEPEHAWQRCDECCRRFTSEAELEAHRVTPCALDQMTKPELFSLEQQAVFRTMNRQIGGKGTPEKKFQWVFGELFPDHEEKDSIWPWYDFASFTHLLRESPTARERERIAGGLRLSHLSDSSPSVQSDSPTFEAPAGYPPNVFLTTASVGQPETGQRIHPEQGYNLGQSNPSLRRASAPAHMLYPGLSQPLGYGYHRTAVSTIPSLPHLTEDDSIITSHPPRTPSIFDVAPEMFNPNIGAAGGFVAHGMLSAPNLGARAPDYFLQQQQQPVLDDTLLPTGLRPVPPFNSDEFRAFSEGPQGQQLYTGEFWGKYDGADVPYNLHNYQQPAVTVGGNPHFQAQPPRSLHQGDAAADDANPAPAQHQWGQQQYDPSLYGPD